MEEQTSITMSSRARQLCYPRSNFSVIPRLHQGAHRGSLDQTFVFGFSLVINPITLAFALALYSGLLTRLSQPLGPADIKSSSRDFIRKSPIFVIFSAGCHPSQTVHLLLSTLLCEQRKSRRVVFHFCLPLLCDLVNCHLRYTTGLTSQQ